MNPVQSLWRFQNLVWNGLIHISHRPRAKYYNWDYTIVFNGLLLYKVYGDSTLLVLNEISLSSDIPGGEFAIPKPFSYGTCISLWRSIEKKGQKILQPPNSYLFSPCWIEHLFLIIITPRSSNLVENFSFRE